MYRVGEVLQREMIRRMREEKRKEGRCKYGKKRWDARGSMRN
jgi:hypothetical protein